jgi:HEAT repeat protein
MAITAFALGLAVLVGAGIAAKDWIAEEWWLRKLESADQEKQIQAARHLGEIRSVRAIPLLLDLSRFPVNRGVQLWSVSIDALVRIGPPVVPPLISRLKMADYATRLDAAFTLSLLGPVATNATPALIEALDDENDLVRTTAATALARIQAATAGSREPW